MTQRGGKDLKNYRADQGGVFSIPAVTWLKNIEHHCRNSDAYGLPIVYLQNFVVAFLKQVSSSYRLHRGRAYAAVGE
jgi:hypothetical protein